MPAYLHGMGRGDQGAGLLFSRRTRAGHGSLEEHAERVLKGRVAELPSLLARLERARGEQAEQARKVLAEPLLEHTYAGFDFEQIPDPCPETEALEREAIRTLQQRAASGEPDPFGGGLDPYAGWLADELGPLGEKLLEQGVFPLQLSPETERATAAAYRLIAGALTGERTSGALERVVEELGEQYKKAFADQVRFQIELLELTEHDAETGYFIAGDPQEGERRLEEEWKRFAEVLRGHESLEELDEAYHRNAALAVERRLRELAETGEIDPFAIHAPSLHARLSPDQLVEWARLFLAAEHQKAREFLHRCAEPQA